MLGECERGAIGEEGGGGVGYSSTFKDGVEKGEYIFSLRLQRQLSLEQDGTRTSSNGKHRQGTSDGGTIVGASVPVESGRPARSAASARTGRLSAARTTRRRARAGRSRSHGRRHGRAASATATTNACRRTARRSLGERGDTITDRSVRLAVGSSGGGEWGLGSDGLADCKVTNGAALSVGTSVSLGKGGGGPVGLGVKTGRVSGITIALCKAVVGVVSGHDPLTAHNVESVLALKGGRVGRVLRDTDTETVLVVRHVAGMG